MSRDLMSRLLPDDHLERVYAGVLGKLIGVYIGRPFENWTHQEIVSKLGHIRYYVHEQFNEPLVITDDDVSGTFQFVRALEEHGASVDLKAADIGRTWLNNVIEHKTIFWWGGRGVSTEHTAFLNLQHGIAAPDSGSIKTNGKTVAEQIGAQIFIDGWALVSPGNPKVAAKLAFEAGSVSHDGESVYAAQLWAAMEAEAFTNKDVDHLLDTGLSVIPQDCLIAQVITQVREWAKVDGDWLRTRQQIEDNYGYDRFHGTCHVVPNHAIMIMALIYGGHDFDEAIHIINTCGWDTDCNSGNVGCLVAIMHGLDSFKGGQDWLGPLADQALISSADSGYSINNAARIALDLTNIGRRLQGSRPLPPPKEGAQYHFTLPGSVQGFQAIDDTASKIRIEQGYGSDGQGGLAINIAGLSQSDGSREISTPTFTPRDVLRMKTYELMASPLVYPGQKLTMRFCSTAPDTTGPAEVGFRAQIYRGDQIEPVDGPSAQVSAGNELDILTWSVPDDMQSQPIQRIGLYVKGTGVEPYTGTIWLESVSWTGGPSMTLRRPDLKPCDFWYRSWVSGVDVMHKEMPRSMVLSQSQGEGIVIYGTRDWEDYRINVPKFKVNMGAPAGIAIRVQGLNRYYSLVLMTGDKVALVKAVDEQRVTLATAGFKWALDEDYDFTLEAHGQRLQGRVNGVKIEASDSQYPGGGLGLLVTGGSMSTDEIHIGPVDYA